MFVNSLNHFRAIAIVFIVAGHSLFMTGVIDESVTNIFETALINIIAGGTSLFVFISGFLFHHVFYKKYEFIKFMKGKLKNVLTPYLLLGILPIMFYISKGETNYSGFFLATGDGWFEHYVIPAIKYYWTGAFLTAYWYVPFVLVTFLMSPLHVLFIKQSNRLQLFFIFIFSIVAIIIHRPIDNLSVFQSVLYFFPVYLFGLWCSINKEFIYAKLKNKELYLVILIVLIAGLQASLSQVGNYHKAAFNYTSIDLMFIQKNIMCLFFMVWLHRFEQVNNRFLHTVAATSFTVFFLHPYIIWIIQKVSKNISLSDYYNWMAYPVYVASILLICIYIALLTKRILPKFSRYIIGY